MKIKIPNDVKLILQKLENNKHQAYIVGGCVRDALLRIKCKDYDITTDARTNEIKKIFKDYPIIETGIKHGTVTIVINKKNYEITTFRSDGIYLDHRHPEDVKYTNNLEEDLARRDFTINAMAYNEKEGLIDLYNGENDLYSGFIRTVGDGDQRFREDALRILRALRFASTINFSISPLTSKAIFNNRYFLNYVSKERIISEFKQIILSNFGKDIMLEYRDIFYILFPILNQLPFYHYEARIKQLFKAEKNFEIRWAILFSGIYENNIFLSQQPLSNQEVTNIEFLWRYQNIKIPNNEISIKTFLSQIEDDKFLMLIAYQKAINNIDEKQYDDYLESYNNIKKTHQIYRLKDLAINGVDLILLGYKNVEVGNALNFALKKVIEGQLPNDRVVLKNFFSRID